MNCPELLFAALLYHTHPIDAYASSGRSGYKSAVTKLDKIKNALRLTLVA